MASKTPSRYIQFYTAGSTASVIYPTAPATTLPQQQPLRKKKRIVISVDPVAILGIAVAKIMLVAMLIGVGNLTAARESSAAMARHLGDLANENARLQSVYADGYDADAVTQQVLDMGYVPLDTVTHR